MKAMLLATALLCVLVGGFAQAADDARPLPTSYVIRVASAMPGTEVKFDAAILFRSSEAPLQRITRKTPFELRSEALAASAMFRSLGSTDIRVELRGIQDGKERTSSTATGRAIVLGDNVVQNESGFITNF